MNWVNTTQVGDNLEIMKSLPSNSIDLIYCDILYGTGRDFGDYKDLPAKKEVIEDFYIPRIKQMHRLLKNTGSIYLQMDTRINHWIRCILDDVFGYNYMRNQIVNKTKLPAKNKKSIKTFSNCFDVILYYTKSNKYTFNPVFCEIKEDSILKRFTNKDEKGIYESVAIEHLKSNPRFNMVYEYKGYTPKYGWHMEKDKLIEFDKLGLLFFTKSGKPRRKRYLNEDSRKIPASTLWEFLQINSIYPTQKPKELLKRIIEVSTNNGDLIGDFFCGSGTTVEVANELGRNYFACDINSRAIEITNKRLQESRSLFSSNY